MEALTMFHNLLKGDCPECESLPGSVARLTNDGRCISCGKQLLNSHVTHIHESYDWYCGYASGIQTTNDKHVTCPECLKQKPLDSSVDLMAEVVRFADEFGFSMDLAARMDKCIEEDDELHRAYAHGDYDNMIDEGADRVITGLLLLRSLGVHPLAAVICKIDKSRRERRKNQ